MGMATATMAASTFEEVGLVTTTLAIYEGDQE